MFSDGVFRTEWGREAQGAINDAAFRFAKDFVILCPDLSDAELMQVIQAIQRARLLANQIIFEKERR